ASLRPPGSLSRSSPHPMAPGATPPLRRRAPGLSRTSTTRPGVLWWHGPLATRSVASSIDSIECASVGRSRSVSRARPTPSGFADAFRLRPACRRPGRPTMHDVHTDAPLVLIPQHFGSLVFDRRTSKYLPFDAEATALLLRLRAESFDAVLTETND